MGGGGGGFGFRDWGNVRMEGSLGFRLYKLAVSGYMGGGSLESSLGWCRAVEKTGHRDWAIRC